jgi:hypothetical protein
VVILWPRSLISFTIRSRWNTEVTTPAVNSLSRVLRAAGFEKYRVGGDAASVDRCVGQKHAPFLWQQRAQARVVVAGARGLNVGLAALEQQREVALAGGRVLGLLAFLCARRSTKAVHRLTRFRILLVGQAERLAT